MARKKPIITCVVALGFLVAVVLLAVFVVVESFRDYYTIATLHHGDTTVTVEADSAWEVSQGVYVRAAGPECHVPGTFIGSTLEVDQLTFSLVPLDGQPEVVVLVETHSPDIVLAIIQLNSSTSWPRDMSRTEAKALLPLQPNGTPRFRLSDEVGGVRLLN